MQRHSALSDQILRQVDSSAVLADLAWAHHERLDGRGNPSSLEDSQLPIPVRFLVVADMFVAQSAARPLPGRASASAVSGG
jgi:HD-GYP domain-containing protein (c-di-GMP phosphodiesterase class II)